MFKRLSMLIVMLSVMLSSDTISKVKTQTDKARAEYLKNKTEESVGKMSEKAQEEYKKYTELLKKESSEKNIVIYFTSQSLDGSHQISLTKEISLLNRDNAQITIAPIVRGFDDGVILYGKSLYEKIKELPPLQLKAVKASSDSLRVNPRMFELLSITEVPAIVTARCSTKKLSKESCKFYYVARGKASLRKVSEIANVSISNLFSEAVK